MPVNSSDSWVSRAALADVLNGYLRSPEALSQRELARRAGLDRRMLRKILSGQTSGWVRAETADRLLHAADLPEAWADLDVMISAG